MKAEHGRFFSSKNLNLKLDKKSETNPETSDPKIPESSKIDKKYVAKKNEYLS